MNQYRSPRQQLKRSEKKMRGKNQEERFLELCELVRTERSQKCTEI